MHKVGRAARAGAVLCKTNGAVPSAGVLCKTEWICAKKNYSYGYGGYPYAYVCPAYSYGYGGYAKTGGRKNLQTMAYLER